MKMRHRIAVFMVSLLVSSMAIATCAQAQTITLDNGLTLDKELAELLYADNQVSHQVVNITYDILQCIEYTLENEVATNTWQECREVGMEALEPRQLRHAAIEDAIARYFERVRS